MWLVKTTHMSMGRGRVKTPVFTTTVSETETEVILIAMSGKTIESIHEIELKTDCQDKFMKLALDKQISNEQEKLNASAGRIAELRLKRGEL